jgi:hypothetical protein
MGCCFSSGEPTEVGPAFDPVIGLSSKNKAPTVTVQGSTISGSGSVLAEMPVLQDKAYFETTVVTPGSFAIGFATKDSPLDGVLSQDTCATAWTLTHKLKVMEGVAPGEVVGCALDQGDYPVQIYFYRSGKVVHQISGVRGEVCRCATAAPPPPPRRRRSHRAAAAAAPPPPPRRRAAAADRSAPARR